VGIELSEPLGKHNGTSKGHTYFKCPKKCGLLVAPGKVTLVSIIGNEGLYDGPVMDAAIMETNFGSVSELPFAPPASDALDATNDDYGASIVALLAQGSRPSPAHHGGDSASDGAVAGTVSHGSSAIAETRFDVAATSGSEEEQHLAVSQQSEPNDEEFEC
jgi:hypothetical protein